MRALLDSGLQSKDVCSELEGTQVRLARLMKFEKNVAESFEMFIVNIPETRRSTASQSEFTQRLLPRSSV